MALRTLRNHRLLELFLVEMLDVPWDKVHQEAELLEYVLSDELAERIAAKLGNPESFHGDPIPGADLDFTERQTRALEEVDIGETVRLRARLGRRPGDAALPVRARDQPGSTLTLTQRQPFGGPLTVRHADGDHLGGSSPRRCASPERRQPSR